MTGIMCNFLCRYGSLGLDFMLVLNTCAEKWILDKYYNFLLNEYYVEFTSVLKLLGSDQNSISIEDIENEIKSSAIFGVGMGFEGLIFTLFEDDDVAEIDEISVSMILNIIYSCLNKCVFF